MSAFLLSRVPEKLESLIVEGVHKPGSLTLASGVWISHAGSFVLEKGDYPLNPHEQWVWLAVEVGELVVRWGDHDLSLETGFTCFLPGGKTETVLRVSKHTRCLWVALDGPLSPLAVRKMGALLHMPLLQGALPSQLYLAEQIVQVIVRHSGTADATYQLQHLLYGMIASHWGQPVAIDAMLSHEIAKVVDTLRANQYKDNFSLADMAAISRMPMETFRKRFVAEVGMPPLSYVLHCKMERAKELLRDQNYSVRQAGIEVGMQDPYHFSKQFKHIVGLSPSAFMKQCSVPNATIRGVMADRKKRNIGRGRRKKISPQEALAAEEALSAASEETQGGTPAEERAARAFGDAARAAAAPEVLPAETASPKAERPKTLRGRKSRKAENQD